MKDKNDHIDAAQQIIVKPRVIIYRNEVIRYS